MIRAVIGAFDTAIARYQGPDLAYARHLIDQASKHVTPANELNLAACNLSAEDLKGLLPEIQDKIPELHTLRVCSIRLKTLPVELQDKFPRLRKLSIAIATNLEQIPSDLYDFIRGLERFDCRGTKLNEETLRELGVQPILPCPSVGLNYLVIPVRTRGGTGIAAVPCTSPRPQ